MPSSTFFNLPPEKREKFLTAARAEFARVAYPQTSINQMIRGAGIPRGSFYMYFRDKEELFSYLLGDCVCHIEALLIRLLEEQKGDLFAALPALYNYVITTAKNPTCRSTYLDVLKLMNLNGTSVLGAFIEQATPSILAVLRAGVDHSRLDLHKTEDFDACMLLLLPATATAVRDGILSTDSAAIRKRFLNTLDILARGMAPRNVNR